MNNLIFTAFAFKYGHYNSPQLGGKVNNNTIEIYVKNIFVSLKSAKIYNPQNMLQ